MAQLPIIENNRMQIDQAPGAVAPRANYTQVNPVGLQEASRAQESMAQALDRISETMFGVARKFAEEAGYQYVASNPLSQDQLQAIVSGDVNKVITTGPSINIMANVARKARAFEVSGHAEIAARNEMAKMLPDIELGKVTTDDIKTKIATVTDGYSKAISQIDPEASLKFRATVGAIGNTYIEKAATAEIRRQKAQAEIKLDIGYQTFQRELEEIFSRESWGFNAQGRPITANQVADALRNDFISNALMLGDATIAKKYADQLPKDISQAKINAVTKYITNDTNMSDPMAMYERLRRGDAGNLTPVYQTLMQDEKAKVMANLMTVVANRSSISKIQRDEDDRTKKDEALNLYEQWLDPKATDGQKRALRTKMLELNVLTFDQTKSLFEAEGANPGVIFRIEDMIDNGQITNSQQLMDQATRAGVSGQQIVELRRRMSTKVGKEETTLYRSLIGVVGDGPVVINKNSAEAKAQEKLDSYLANERDKAVADGKPFNRYDALMQFRKQRIERMNSESAKAAKEQLKVYETKAGGPITSENLPALEQRVANKKVDIKPAELQQIRRLVNRAEGNE